jgi:hypothetical protein
MQKSLTPELDSQVSPNTASDGKEAIDRNKILGFDPETLELRKQLQLGIDQLQQGEGISIDSKADLDALFKEIRSEATQS